MPFSWLEPPTWRESCSCPSMFWMPTVPREPCACGRTSSTHRWCAKRASSNRSSGNQNVWRPQGSWSQSGWPWRPRRSCGRPARPGVGQRPTVQLQPTTGALDLDGSHPLAYAGANTRSRSSSLEPRRGEPSISSKELETFFQHTLRPRSAGGAQRTRPPCIKPEDIVDPAPPSADAARRCRPDWPVRGRPEVGDDGLIAVRYPPKLSEVWRLAVGHAVRLWFGGASGRGGPSAAAAHPCKVLSSGRIRLRYKFARYVLSWLLLRCGKRKAYVHAV